MFPNSVLAEHGERVPGKVWGVLRNKDVKIWKVGFASQVDIPKGRRLDGGAHIK